MNLTQRRIKVLEKMLDNTLNDILEAEIGIEIKQTVLMANPTSEDADKIQKAIRQSEFIISQLQRAAEIMDRKLKEAVANEQ